MRLIVQGTLENPERVPKVQSAQAPNLSGKRTEHIFLQDEAICLAIFAFSFSSERLSLRFFCFVGGYSFKKEKTREGKSHERSITKHR